MAELKGDRAQAVLRHLLRKCPSCLSIAPAALRIGNGSAPDSEDAYDAAIGRAVKTARQHHRRWHTVQQLMREVLVRLEDKGLEALQTLPRKYQGLPTIEALLERSWNLRHEDPSQMVELAKFAEIVARDLDVRKHGFREVADLKCRIWSNLANAYRVSEDLDEAQSSFDRAYEHYLSGTGDRLLLARYLDLLSSLFRARRQFGLVRATLNLAFIIYLRSGEKHLAGRTLLNMAIFTGYSGEPEKALLLLKRALTLVDENRDASLVFTAVHNQLWFLVEAGQYEAAQKLLFLNRRRYEDGGRLNRLKLRWLEARIDAAMGKPERAENIFWEVKEGFEQADLGYQAAVATLDLAAVLLRQRRAGEARETAIEAAETFRRLGIHREAMAAVLILRESFRMGVATIELLEDVITFLRRAENDPEARFNPRMPLP